MLLTENNLKKLDQQSEKSLIQTSIYPRQATSQAPSSKTISSVCQKINPEMKQQIKEIYNKLDSGKMKPQEAKNIMEQQLGIKVTPELAKNINKIDSKFKDIWNNIQKQKQINILPTEKPTSINPHSNTLHIKGYTDNLPRYQAKRLNVKPAYEQNTAKEALLSLCQQVCSGQELSKGFQSKLKNNNLELSELAHELKELESSSQKLFRAIDNKEDKFNYEKPLVHTNPKILTEYYSNRSTLSKNYTSKHPETSEQTIDIKHKHETAYQTFHQPTSLNPVFSASMFSVISPKRHLEIQSTKAMQNNGNIITWKNPKKIGEQKDVMKEQVVQSRVKANYQKSPEKWKSKFDLNHSEIFQTLPKSTRAKNIKDFKGNGDIISWNSTKIN